jgi:translation initiation factor 5
MINIGCANNLDDTYRYRMPRLLIKNEGRGNGIKTVLVNLGDVVHALHVHPSTITLHLGTVSS